MEGGREVRSIASGDQVIVSSVSACGRCQFCRDRMSGQCGDGRGWILGRLINGTQAEFVRVPFADFSTRRRPGALALADAVLLAEVLPTAYEVGGGTDTQARETPSWSCAPVPSGSPLSSPPGSAHRVGLSETVVAYDVFLPRPSTGALKVVLRRE